MGLSSVWRKSITQMVWANGEGHAAKTEVLQMNGRIEAICIRASAATDNPTFAVTITDSKGNSLYNSGNLADGTNYAYTPGEFLPSDEPILVVGGNTISVDPSADSGANSLTVDIDIYGRE